jgi:glyoxylase-like metal-dependent hydrolase (beta-lactamase superfamily II)
MAQLRGKVISYVIFSKPDASGGDVKESELWHAAARIPGVTPIFDPQSIETERFGGHVSGQTILYDPKGNLVFSGGITSARGHEGDNDGADAILRGVTGQKGSLASTPVFGCSLHNPGASPRNEDPSWNGR